MTANLKEAESAFDNLDLNDRILFCDYFASRFIAPPSAQKLDREESIAAWERMKQLGAEMGGCLDAV